jgi:hypothetical protein
LHKRKITTLLLTRVQGGVVRMDMLCGWKEISEHLHLTVRTAQRWEKAGLPVHRVYDSKRSPVVTTVAELDLWLRSKPTPASKQQSAARDWKTAVLQETQSRQRSLHRRNKRLLTKLQQLKCEQRRWITLIRANLTDRKMAKPLASDPSDRITRTA